MKNNIFLVLVVALVLLCGCESLNRSSNEYSQYPSPMVDGPDVFGPLYQGEDLIVYYDDISNHYGYKLSDGEIIIKARFGIASQFNDKYAVVMELRGENKDEKKWGIINRRGYYFSDPIYDEIESFEDGYATATLDGRNYIIDTEGKVVD